MRETWEAIARKRNAQKQFRTELHTNATSAPAPAMHADIIATNADSMLGTDCHSPHTPIKQQNTRDTIKNVAAVYQYTCPFCAVPVASRVYTGQVDHHHACGNKFRVHAGACWCYFWPRSQTCLPYMRDNHVIFACDWTH